MMFFRNVALVCVVVILTACEQDYSLAPSSGGEEVTISVNVPVDLELKDIQVMYRSERCRVTRYSAAGKPYEIEGHQNSEVVPIKVSNSNVYEARIPKDGGGYCNWELSNVTFEVIYRTPSRFGSDVTEGGGGGVVVIFDDNDSSRGGYSVEVAGDLDIEAAYYPWVYELFLGGYTKRVTLFGEKDMYLMYKAVNAKKITFAPVLYSDFVIHSVGPKVKGEGHPMIYTYPDSSVFADGFHPSFRKLESIRHGAEGTIRRSN